MENLKYIFFQGMTFLIFSLPFPLILFSSVLCEYLWLPVCTVIWAVESTRTAGLISKFQASCRGTNFFLATQHKLTSLSHTHTHCYLHYDISTLVFVSFRCVFICYRPLTVWEERSRRSSSWPLPSIPLGGHQNVPNPGCPWSARGCLKHFPREDVQEASWPDARTTSTGSSQPWCPSSSASLWV